MVQATGDCAKKCDALRVDRDINVEEARCLGSQSIENELINFRTMWHFSCWIQSRIGAILPQVCLGTEKILKIYINNNNMKKITNEDVVFEEMEEHDRPNDPFKA